MKMRSFLFAALSLISTSSSSRADDRDDDEANGPEAKAEHPVSIVDLLRVSTRLNADFAKARADMETAKQEAAAADLDHELRIVASGGIERNAIGDAVPVLPYTSVAEDKYSGSVGVAYPLPVGGTAEVDLGAQHTKQEYAVPDLMTQSTTMGMQPPDEFVEATQATLTFKLEMPLLRKFGPNIAYAPQHKAELAEKAAMVKAQLAAEDLIKDVVTSYWELAYTAYEVEVRQQALDLAKHQDQVTHDLIRAGTVSPGQAGTVAYELATRDEALLHSKTDWEAKSLDLRRKVGLEIGRRDVVLRGAEPFEIGREQWDITSLVDHAKKSNRKLAVLQLQRKSADIDVDVASDNELPDLTVTGSLAAIGGDKFSGNAFSSLASGAGFTAGINFKFQYEVGGAAKAAHEAAVAKRHHVDIERVDAERQIETDIVAAVHQVDSSRVRVELSEKAISVADDAVRAEHTAFNMAKSTNQQVMQKEQQLIDARLKRGRAVADYHIAVCKLQYLAGVLIEQYEMNPRTSTPKVSRATRRSSR